MKIRRRKKKNYSLFIGIDPGGNGAIAIINRKRKLLLLKDYPGNEKAAAKILRKFVYQKNAIACLEKVHAMPKQGVTSMFNFGANFGAWKGILSAFQIRFTLPTPKAWKKEMIKTPKRKLSKKQKKKLAVKTTIKMFPKVKSKLYGPRGGMKDGRAEALLIAEYCRRHFIS